MNEIALKNTIWSRLLFMILFWLIYSAAKFVLLVTVILQFGFVLLTNKRNDELLTFSANLSAFIFAILRYVTFNTEDKPFPFAAWPDAA